MKEQILQLIKTFGLHVDLDCWDEKGWIRVTSNDWPIDFGNAQNCIIIWKDDVKIEGIQIVHEELIQSLIRLGGALKAREFRKLLNL